jgi:hypothetical protein
LQLRLVHFTEIVRDPVAFVKISAAPIEDALETTTVPRHIIASVASVNSTQRDVCFQRTVTAILSVTVDIVNFEIAMLPILAQSIMNAIIMSVNSKVFHASLDAYQDMVARMAFVRSYYAGPIQTALKLMSARTINVFPFLTIFEHSKQI